MNLHQTLARVSILIVNYNAGPWLARAVEPFVEPESAGPEIIIADNGSADDSLQRLQEIAHPHPHPNPPPQENLPPPLAGAGRGGGGNGSGSEGNNITIDRAGRNLGFAAGINRAARQATREFLLLLNPDCRIEPATLARLIAELDNHPKAALVSGKVIGTDGREQRGSRRKLPTPSLILGEMLPFSSNGVDLTRTPAPEQSLEVEALSGACMLIRAEVFRALGGLDEGYPMHFEDLDLFRRLIDAGHQLRWVPEAEIIHAGGHSSRARPAGVVLDKHRGLWRYLNRHCRATWPAWQRPFWALALALHLCLRLALAGVLRR